MEKWTEWRTIYVVWKNGEDRLVDSMQRVESTYGGVDNRGEDSMEQRLIVKKIEKQTV